ncbi:hypothetical protein [Leucobacter luti]|nr:hypothetical protein [Leucobacter luti]
MATVVSTPRAAIWAIIPAALIMAALLGTLLRRPGPSPKIVGLAALISGIAYAIAYTLAPSFVATISALAGSGAGIASLDFTNFGAGIAYMLMFITFVTGDTLFAIILSLIAGYVVRRITTNPAPASRYNRRS